MIDKTSRYAKVAELEVVDDAGEVEVVLELRETPRSTGVFRHTPLDGERLDHIAQRYYRDPKKFWKVCDASDVMDPFDVVVTGRPIVIPPDK